MNLYFSLLDTGIEQVTGSIKTIVNTDETNLTELTKRLGEVDYTRAESLLRITSSSANRNRAMNINDQDKSHSLKDIETSTSSLPRIDLTKGFDHCRGPVAIKKLAGTGVHFMKFTAFLRLERFAACTDTAT